LTGKFHKLGRRLRICGIDHIQATDVAQGGLSGAGFSPADLGCGAEEPLGNFFDGKAMRIPELPQADPEFALVES
jgi:hypothetical protein